LRAIVLMLLLVPAYAEFAFGSESTATATAEGPRWTPISGTSGYRSAATGDPLSHDGATATIDSVGTATGPFGGVIGSVDLEAYRGREIEVSADIEVAGGPGSAAIWVRADGDGRKPSFATSAGMPVLKGELQRRRVPLYVPADSTQLVLGAIVQGEARARIAHLKVSAMPSTMSAVDAHAVLEAAFSLVTAQALNAPSTDLAALRAQLLTDALRGASPLEAYPRIDTLLEALGDGHSVAMPPAQAATHRTGGSATGDVSSRLIDGVGYVLVPGFSGKGDDASRKFVAGICDALTRLAPRAAKGWVVDLRENTGGNLWPMLGGLKPLLGVGVPGWFRDRTNDDTPWNIGAGACDLAVPANAAVAVLLGPDTASSGEAVAIAFSGRANARSFGRHTAGRSTANMSLDLPDGGLLLLTGAIDVDRKGKAFPSGVEPDVEIDAAPHAADELAVAVEWLQRLP
jgi:hypothetical protein